jgi:hypothetical protein
MKRKVPTDSIYTYRTSRYGEHRVYSIMSFSFHLPGSVHSMALVLASKPLPLRAVTGCVLQLAGASGRRLSLSAGTNLANLVSFLPDPLSVTQPSRFFHSRLAGMRHVPSPLLLGQSTHIQYACGLCRKDMKIHVRHSSAMPIAKCQGGMSYWQTQLKSGQKKRHIGGNLIHALGR